MPRRGRRIFSQDINWVSSGCFGFGTSWGMGMGVQVCARLAFGSRASSRGWALLLSYASF